MTSENKKTDSDIFVAYINDLDIGVNKACSVKLFDSRDKAVAFLVSKALELEGVEDLNCIEDVNSILEIGDDSTQVFEPIFSKKLTRLHNAWVEDNPNTPENKSPFMVRIVDEYLCCLGSLLNDHGSITNCYHYHIEKLPVE